MLTDNSSTTKFKAWINYSPEGVLGLMWRSVLPAAAPVAALLVASAADPVANTAAPTDCGQLGCGLPPDDPNEEDPPPFPYTVLAVRRTTVERHSANRWRSALRPHRHPIPT